MAAIGNSPTQQAFTPAIDYFSGNGSTTAFTLSRPVASVAQVQVTIDNVAQNPSSAYTVSANTITFTSAPLSGTNNIYVYYTSPITQVIAPGQGTVNTTALGNITNIASGNSSLTLQTGSGNTTAITVDTSQRVGVGVTPSDWGVKVLQAGAGAVASGAGTATTGFTNNLYTSDAFSTYKYINTGYANMYYQDGNHRWFNVASGSSGATATISEVMRIDTSGNVGIGTTSPATRFDVRCASDVTQDIAYFSRPDAAVRCKISLDGSGLINFGTSTSHPLAFLTGNTERMRITSDGNLNVNRQITSFTTNGFGVFGATNIVTVADGATITLSSGSSSQLISLTCASTGTGGAFFANYNTTVSQIGGSSTSISTTDAGTVDIAIYKSANSNTVTFKNRSGASRVYRIAMFCGENGGTV
jgi:hypothetical protein